MAHDPDDALPSYTPGRSADWSLIPRYMIGGLRRYIEHGVAPGHFLTAVLSNDLRGAFERADDVNSAAIGNYLRFLYNYAPTGCWGSADRFNAWCQRGGLSERAA